MSDALDQYASVPRTMYNSGIDEIRGMPSPTNFENATGMAAKESKERHHKIVRYWMACCGALVVLAPLISIILGLELKAKQFSYTPDITNPSFAGRSLLLEAVLISADPMSSVMTFDWTVIAEQNSCSNATLNQCTSVDIFFDNNLLVQKDSSGELTSNIPGKPLFTHNATLATTADIKANTPTFRTNLQLFSPNNHQSSLIFYPFDVYTAEISVFALDHETNATVGLKLISTRGIAVGFKTDAIDYPGEPIPAGILDIFVTLKRGNLIITFCLIATVAVWLITLVLLLLMFTAVVFGFRQRGEVLVVPVATVFAFTQLRNSMPGAPAGFGDTLDFVGLLPCLAMLSISAALTLGAFILTDPTETPHVLTWDLIRTKAFMKQRSDKSDKESVEATNDTKFNH